MGARTLSEHALDIQWTAARFCGVEQPLASSRARLETANNGYERRSSRTAQLSPWLDATLLGASTLWAIYLIRGRRKNKDVFLEILGANPIIFFRPGSIPNASRSTGLRLLARRVKRIRLFARSPINLSKNTDSYPAFLSRTDVVWLVRNPLGAAGH